MPGLTVLRPILAEYGAGLETLQLIDNYNPIRYSLSTPSTSSSCSSRAELFFPLVQHLELSGFLDGLPYLSLHPRTIHLDLLPGPHRLSIVSDLVTRSRGRLWALRVRASDSEDWSRADTVVVDLLCRYYDVSLHWLTV